MARSKKPSWQLAELPLSCPSCAIAYPLSESFCARCGRPLVYAAVPTVKAEASELSESDERRGRINPEYTGGQPVKVAFAQNQAEAELIQGLLLEEGIPSFLRRSRGFDVPDFLAAGPRDVLVPESGAEAAKGLLEATRQGNGHGDPAEVVEPRPVNATKLAGWMVGAAAAAAILVWALYQLRF
jgi:hypothetical protein